MRKRTADGERRREGGGKNRKRKNEVNKRVRVSRREGDEESTRYHSENERYFYSLGTVLNASEMENYKEGVVYYFISFFFLFLFRYDLI